MGYAPTDYLRDKTMLRFKKKYPRQDGLTGEWFFEGKWYDEYPHKEVDAQNSRYDEYMEYKYDEMRDEGKL